MRKKVLYLIKAGEDFYDLIRSVMPDDRYELLTLQDGSNGERRQLLEQAELVIVGGARMSEKDVDDAQRKVMVALRDLQGKNEITLIPEQKTSADDQGDKEDESKVD